MGRRAGALCGYMHAGTSGGGVNLRNFLRVTELYSQSLHGNASSLVQAYTVPYSSMYHGTADHAPVRTRRGPDRFLWTYIPVHHDHNSRWQMGLQKSCRAEHNCFDEDMYVYPALAFIVVQWGRNRRCVLEAGYRLTTPGRRSEPAIKPTKSRNFCNGAFALPFFLKILTG